MTKQQELEKKAITIKGNKYILVSDRVKYFNDICPNGTIETKLLSEPNDDRVVVKARIWPDVDNKPNKHFDGLSQAVVGDGMVNKTAALENAETSAVGRALAFMGVGVIDSIASADEINKAGVSSGKMATGKQIDWIRGVASKISGYDQSEDIDAWVEEQLTVRPGQIPVYKVKDAVDKLNEIGRELDEQDRIKAKMADDEPVPEVTDQDLQDLKDGKLPY